jgi:hypothetical protein
MSRTNDRTLIDRGRKAGLGTGELYQALTARPPEAGDHAPGQTDGNGFVAGYALDGRRVYQPVQTPGRPD